MQLAELQHTETIEAIRSSGWKNGIIPDPTEVQSFCRHLSGVTGSSMDELRIRLSAVPLPDGYHSYRIFNEETGQELASSWGSGQSRITAMDVVVALSTHLVTRTNAWRETRTTEGTKFPGVLDLLVDVDQEPRPAGTFDLPDMVEYWNRPFGWLP